MTKKLVLTAFVALLSTVIALAQTEPNTNPSPAKRGEKMEKAKQKDKSDKIEHAEERSNGAAFSGRGKGGDKDRIEKGEKGKGKGKAKGKGKDKKKDKSKVKGKKSGDNNGQKDDDGNSNGNEEKNRSREAKEIGKEKAPKQTTPENGARRNPGDKPAPGSEKQKEPRSRG